MHNTTRVVMQSNDTGLQINYLMQSKGDSHVFMLQRTLVLQVNNTRTLLQIHHNHWPNPEHTAI